jgi:threonine/homoserine/homoserine lactone efflux protein
MDVLQALAGFALVAGLLTIIPGLDTALVLRSSISAGRGHGFATALGICTGALVWGAAAAVGATAILVASEVAFTVLKLAGAAYLAYLGISLLVQKPANAQHPAVRVGTLKASYGKGVLTNLLNPKVGVFYIAIIPQFIPEGTVPLLMGLALALVHVVESMVYFTAIIFATHAARRLFVERRVTRWVDRVTGGVLLAFAGILVAEELV